MIGLKPMFSLEGRRALVTGAGRGIGRAIAEALGQAGANVTLCARTTSEINAAVQDLNDQGLHAEGFTVDVTNTADFALAISELPAFNIFVNNAGTNRPMPQVDVTTDDYDAVMDLNVRAAYFAAQAVSLKMINAKSGGSIINMSSQMGHVGAANRTLYCMSKWALEGFTKALAIELGPNNIRVNTLCPTFVETPMTKSYFEDPVFRESVLAKIKLGRLAQYSDIVGAAIFLASDASAMMTGSALMIDGGWTAD